MNLLWLISICLMGVYFLRMLSFRAGWTRIRGNPEVQNESRDEKSPVESADEKSVDEPTDVESPEESPDISVVIPVRDEEHNLGLLLEELARQDYPNNRLEILVVDDHSRDGTPDLVKRFSRDHEGFRHIALDPSESGKKAALKKGVTAARSDLILTTDGDCRVSSEWVRSMVAGFFEGDSRNSTPKVRMVSAAVTLDPDRGVFHAMQALELHSLNASSAGSAGLNDPVLCSAANLACTRTDYIGYLKEEVKVSESGDDIFLMLWLKKKFPGSIRFSASREAVVRTRPADSLRSFFMQRMRWSSKVRHYRDASTIGTAGLVFSMNFLLFVLALAIPVTFLLKGIWEPELLKIFGMLFLVKSLADLLLLVPYLRHYGKSGLLRYFLPVQMNYFVYVSLCGLLGQFLPFTWKGRKIKVLKSNRTDESER